MSLIEYKINLLSLNLFCIFPSIFLLYFLSFVFSDFQKEH